MCRQPIFREGVELSSWWHRIQQNEQLKGRLLLATVYLVASLSFLLQIRFIFLSDPAYLVTTRMQDDSFYYLQPARMFVQTRRFTFDGYNVTYGFQPLWMLLIVILAYVVPDRWILVLASLIMGSVFYCGTGLLLYVLARRFTGGLGTLVAPTLWLINPPLLALYTTGKENSLYAFLLVLFLILYYRLVEIPSLSSFILWGIVGGLLVLSRINSIIVVSLLILVCLTIARSSWLQRLKRLLLILFGFLATTLPWFIFAITQLGSLLPNSGSRKLIGAWAALVLALHNGIPALPLPWLSAFLPIEERAFLNSPNELVLPSVERIVDYIFKVLLANSGRFWLEDVLLSSPFSLQGLVWMPYKVLLLLMLVNVGNLVRTRLLREPRRGLTILQQGLKAHSGLVLLGAAAVLNTLTNCLLLPHFIFWNTWYAVPETVFLVIGASIFITFGLKNKLWNKFTFKVASVMGLGIVMLLLILPLAAKFWIDMSPRQYVYKPWYQHEVWEALPWMRANVPKGAVIGSWSSGLVGYADDWTVVNLDGLANSPYYVNTVYRSFALHYRGLTNDNQLWEYVKSQRISYIADADFEIGIGKDSFFESIPPANYEVIYWGQSPMDWGERRGARRFVVLQLKY